VLLPNEMSRLIEKTDLTQSPLREASKVVAVIESEQHSRVTRRLRFVLEVFQLPRQAEVQEQPQLAAQHDKEVLPMSERRLETLSLEADSEFRSGYPSKH
jgi:arginyl-tRNA synthetase